MMHKAWSSIEEVPYCFSRSSVKLQGHAAKKIVIDLCHHMLSVSHHALNQLMHAPRNSFSWSLIFIGMCKVIVMPPPLGARGIMFSGCQSVCPSIRSSIRSLKYPLLTCTWVHWSTPPTVTILRHVRLSVLCLSVRPSGEVSGHLLENA